MKRVGLLKIRRRVALHAILFLVIGFMTSCTNQRNPEELCCNFDNYRKLVIENSNCLLPSTPILSELGTPIAEVLQQHAGKVRDQTYVPEIEDTTRCTNDRIYKGTYFVGKNQLAKCEHILVFCERKLIRQSLAITQRHPKQLTLDIFKEELAEFPHLQKILHFLQPGESMEHKTKCEKAVSALSKIKNHKGDTEWIFSFQHDLLKSKMEEN